MSTGTEADTGPDRAERSWNAFFAALPYLALSLCAVITLLQSVRGEPVDLGAVLGLTAATAAWVFFFVTRPGAPRGNRALMVLYYAGLLALATALVALAPWYGIAALLGYVHAYDLLRGGLRYVGAVATSLLMAVVYLGGFDAISRDEWWLWGAVFLVGAGLSSASFHLADLWFDHDRQQAGMLAELNRSHARLEAALDENAELHARLMARAREAGVLDERQRMAREIHDTLAQGLAGILSQLEAAEHSSGDPAAARRHTATAMSLAREGLSEARRTVRAVEPQALSEARLPDAVGRIVERWSGIHGVAADLTVTGDPRPMHTDVEAALLRAAQEALSNVAKHAEAGRVGLTLSYMEDVVTLDVRDDGTGFVPGDGRSRGPGEGGFGLVAMRQRVRRLAGRVHVESEPGGGTAVSVSVPATPAGGGTP